MKKREQSSLLSPPFGFVKRTEDEAETTGNSSELPTLPHLGPFFRLPAFGIKSPAFGPLVGVTKMMGVSVLCNCTPYSVSTCMCTSLAWPDVCARGGACGEEEPVVRLDTVTGFLLATPESWRDQSRCTTAIMDVA